MELICLFVFLFVCCFVFFCYTKGCGSVAVVISAVVRKVIADREDTDFSYLAIKIWVFLQNNLKDLD